MRRAQAAPPPTRTGPKINENIDATRILLIGSDGAKLGEMPTPEALKLAEEEGLDLVEVAGAQKVPVCKILDYGKLRFEERKKRAANRKRQKSIDLKEIKMRPNIGEHDYEVKTRSMNRFFESGDKVKVTLRFRGREMAHQDIGMELLERVKVDFQEKAKVELEPKLEGRQMTMVMAPR